jgi:hypothetical protein
LLEARDGLAEGGPTRFPVSLLELGELHPTEQGVGRDADCFGRFIYVALRKQGGNRLFLLAFELGAVAFHRMQSGSICPGENPPFQSFFRLPAEIPCLFPRPE